MPVRCDGSMSDGRPRHRQRRPGNKISTPAGQMEIVAVRQEIGGGSGGDGGGSAEEMDLDGAGTADDGGGEPCWAEMTRRQKKDWKRRVGND